MRKFIEIDDWKIIENGFDASRQRAAESIFSLGNGHMGQRANFEEQYSGESLQGSYIAGLYYPDKTKVGWWKIGYPDNYAKIINSVNWIGIDVFVNGKPLDLALCKVCDFQRILNMKKGFLRRKFTAELANGKKIRVEAQRFLSLARPEVAAIQYAVTPLNFGGQISFSPYINGDVKNDDANYNEHFWEPVNQESTDTGGCVTSKTKKLDFHVCAGMCNQFFKNQQEVDSSGSSTVNPMYVEQQHQFSVRQNETITLHKYVTVASCLNHERKRLHSHVTDQLGKVKKIGFQQLFEEQAHAWEKKWINCDIEIAGDRAAQQGIRFNIFQLNQTYTGNDERLNIGPKGFTGEKYGGGTYWDTEGYGLPFYMNTAGQAVAKKLLRYRYRQLPQAKENAQKLGFGDGAALYPMVTMDGYESHNEWEITFEEIHRNGAIAYAIYNYISHTSDEAYLIEGGLEVLIGIARFWCQRFQYSEYRQQYVMLGVTGPNEYENNVQNNWYTNYIAGWSLRYAIQAIEMVKQIDEQSLQRIQQDANLQPNELESWQKIIDQLYLPYDESRGIMLQQDGFRDKKWRPARELDEQERPINQHWSWDRILRSCYIKQADVLQGMYFFEHEFERETIRRNFDFYEPMTVHESSLSPCVHAILASRLGYRQKAYHLYMRTARLDLDDYNEEVDGGLHITSMAGTWMAITEGFGGKSIHRGRLCFSPYLPEKWSSYSFKLCFRGRRIKVEVEKTRVVIRCLKGKELTVQLYDDVYTLGRNAPVEADRTMRSNKQNN